MGPRQKAIIKNFATVIVATAIVVVAMINFKDWVNRSEAMRGMRHLGQIVASYRQEHGSIPPESYIDGVKKALEGSVRLGSLRYRARWVTFEATPDEILAYAEKRYRSLILSRGYIVLRLDGRVEWIEKNEFETLLTQQQSQFEIETLKGRSK